jgi:mono/diheme cytochrome c family protein
LRHSVGDLSGRTVAVEFGSPAQDLLARRDDVAALTVTATEDGLRATTTEPPCMAATEASRSSGRTCDGTQAVAVNDPDDPDVVPLRIPTITKDTSAPTSAPAAAAAPSQVAVPSGATPAGELDGHVIVNGTCAACHGPDAVQAERRINLRLLHARYGSNMDSMFFTTVTDGRPSTGMPSWRGAFTDAELAAVLAYLH